MTVLLLETLAAMDQLACYRRMQPAQCYQMDVVPPIHVQHVWPLNNMFVALHATTVVVIQMKYVMGRLPHAQRINLQTRGLRALYQRVQSLGRVTEESVNHGFFSAKSEDTSEVSVTLTLVTSYDAVALTGNATTLHQFQS
mmetsp:Transcript_21232/g.41642  ORF Transcript_21232/g.41642 Transcript_21232/m.41642 type:complete len:141 (-) Transcript_21232:731-1153(-)